MYDMVKYSIFILTGVLFYSSTLFSQTCSCAGAPILSSLETGAAPVGRWQLGLSWEYHAINDLMDRTREIEDSHNRRRRSQSLVLESSYGLNRYLSLTGIVTLIDHEREVPSFEGPGERLNSSGVGEGLLLLKYIPFRQTPYSSRELALGGGAKFPLGRSGITSRGVVISEDMQPSSGALDGIFWSYAAQSLNPGNTTNLYLTASYRLSGHNSREYDTGNEFLSTLGLSHRAGRFIGGSLGLRYRWAAEAKRRDYNLPNTGGQWLYFVPGVALQMPKSLALRFSAQLPLYRNVKGVQFSTSYATSISVFRTLR